MASLFSIPELDALPPIMRRKLIHDWLRGGIVRHSVQVFVLCAWTFGGVAVLVLLTVDGLGTNIPLTWWVVAGVFAAATAAALGAVWYFIRSELRSHVIEEIPALYGNICAACGYDLRGSPGQECPECGERRIHNSPTLTKEA